MSEALQTVCVYQLILSSAGRQKFAKANTKNRVFHMKFKNSIQNKVLDTCLPDNVTATATNFLELFVTAAWN